MKKIIMSLCMLLSFALAMDAGTKSFGGSGTLTLADPDMTIALDVNCGKFVMDNVQVNVGVNMAGTTDTMTDAIGYSVGANYYMGSMYGGASYGGSTAEGSDGALDFRGGYLMGCGDSGKLFLDLYGNYNMGLGDGAEGVLSFGFGVVTFF